MIRLVIIAFVVLAGALACDRAQKTPDQSPVASPPKPTADAVAQTNAGAAKPAARQAPPGVTAPDSVTRHDELVAGKPREHWIDRFGPADATQTYFVKDGVLEYQIELLNVFREDDPETVRVEIYEDLYDEDGYTFVLWSFRQSTDDPWEAVQAMSYEDGVEF